MFQASFHTIVTSQVSYYAPPDTGVSDLQLVSVEYLPSIEGAGRIFRSAPFCGKVFFVCFAPTGCTPNGFPYEGKLSPEATDEVDCGA